MATNVLRELLLYINASHPKNVKNDDLRSIHSMVSAVKGKAEVTIGFMKTFEKERMLKEEGEIIGYIKSAIEFGVSENIILAKLIEKYHLTQEEALKFYKQIE